MADQHDTLSAAASRLTYTVTRLRSIRYFINDTTLTGKTVMSVIDAAIKDVDEATRMIRLHREGKDS